MSRVASLMCVLTAVIGTAISEVELRENTQTSEASPPLEPEYRILKEWSDPIAGVHFIISVERIPNLTQFKSLVCRFLAERPAQLESANNISLRVYHDLEFYVHEYFQAEEFRQKIVGYYSWTFAYGRRGRLDYYRDSDLRLRSDPLEIEFNHRKECEN